MVVTAAGGQTGAAVVRALWSRGHRVRAVVSGARERPQLTALAADVVAADLRKTDGLEQVLAGAEVLYAIWPNFDPGEAAGMTALLGAARRAGVGRVVYHSVASPYAPAMPHHVGKAVSEDLVRRSGLAWTILQPGAYLQNLDLSGPLDLPYSPDVRFGFLDLADLGRAAAVVLTEPGHGGATYELATRVATVRELADEAGVPVRRVDDPGTHLWLSAMFAYYDDHGLPVGTRVLDALVRR
jgi:uncharacterized protein YbjT (DUF2867 family)